MTLSDRGVLLWCMASLVLSWRTFALWISVPLHKAGCVDKYCSVVHVTYGMVCLERVRALLTDRVASILENVRDQVRSGLFVPFRQDPTAFLGYVDDVLRDRDEAKKRTLREKLGQDPDGAEAKLRLPECDHCGDGEGPFYNSWLCNDAIACVERVAGRAKPTQD